MFKVSPSAESTCHWFFCWGRDIGFVFIYIDFIVLLYSYCLFYKLTGLFATRIGRSAFVPWQKWIVGSKLS